MSQNELSFLRTQPLYEIRDIESFDALLQRRRRANFENQCCGFTPVAPVIQESGLKQLLEQRSTKEDGTHISAGITLLRNEFRVEAYPQPVIGNRLSRQTPNALQVIRVHRR
jgi:hypothetical protein